MLFLAVFMNAVASTVVDRLTRDRVPRVVAILLIYLALLALLAERVGLIAPLLTDAPTAAGDVGRRVRDVGGLLMTGLLILVFALFLAVDTRFAARVVARFYPQPTPEARCATPPGPSTRGGPMYVRVVTGRLRPETLDRSLAILAGEVRPHISARAGFQGWELLVARASGRFHAITRWSSLVEAEGASRDGFGDRAGLLDGLLDGGLDQAVFEVLA